MNRSPKHKQFYFSVATVICVLFLSLSAPAKSDSEKVRVIGESGIFAAPPKGLSRAERLYLPEAKQPARLKNAKSKKKAKRQQSARSRSDDYETSSSSTSRDGFSAAPDEKELRARETLEDDDEFNRLEPRYELRGQSRSQKNSKAFTLRAYPVSAVLRIINTDFNIKVADHFTTGLAVRMSFVKTGTYNEDSSGIGGRFTWFSDSPFSDSFYVTPSLMYRWGTAHVDIDIATATAAIRATTADLIAGYQWQLGMLSIGVALGGSFTWFEISDMEGTAYGYRVDQFVDSSGSGGNVSGELALGFSF